MGWGDAMIAFFSTAITEGVGNFGFNFTSGFFGFIASCEVTGGNFFEGSPAMRTLKVFGGRLAIDVASTNFLG